MRWFACATALASPGPDFVDPRVRLDALACRPRPHARQFHRIFAGDLARRERGCSLPDACHVPLLGKNALQGVRKIPSIPGLYEKAIYPLLDYFRRSTLAIDRHDRRPL